MVVGGGGVLFLNKVVLSHLLLLFKLFISVKVDSFFSSQPGIYFCPMQDTLCRFYNLVHKENINTVISLVRYVLPVLGPLPPMIYCLVTGYLES